MKTFPGLTAAIGACGLLLALQLVAPAAVRAADTQSSQSNQNDQNTQSNQNNQNSQNSTTGTGGANNTSASSDQLSEIVVTGISADLEKALDTKEFAPVMLDSIDSTELGRFPDADVADSLEHLPGITVSRTTGGEGQKITVQGLSSEYNIVTMDNRILASDDSGRDIAFDVLPAELITGADVLKSPEASAVEGSIGGTVNLHTASAFDHPGFHADAHGEGDWNDMPELASKEVLGFHQRHQCRSDARVRARRGGYGSQVAHRLAQRLQPEHLRPHQLSVPARWSHAAPGIHAARRHTLLHHLWLDLR